MPNCRWCAIERTIRNSHEQCTKQVRDKHGKWPEHEWGSLRSWQVRELLGMPEEQRPWKVVRRFDPLPKENHGRPWRVVPLVPKDR